MACIHAAIAERAGEQLGLLRQPDLDELAVTRSQIRTLIAHGVLIRQAPGVYRHVGFERTHHQRMLAAAWAGGTGAALSHASAASIWSFDGVGPGAVELSVPAPRHPRSVQGLVHRVRDLTPVDMTMVGLLPVTTPSRTLIDLSTRFGMDQIEEALDGACRRNQIYLPQLRWRLEQLHRRGRTGPRKLEELLARAPRQRNEESWLESTYIRVTTKAGLPMPRTQVTVSSGPGGKRYRLDATYEPHDLVVEVDGHATHATRRQRQADAERDARLLASGKRVVRFTYEDLTERPDYVNATLSGLLGLRIDLRLDGMTTGAALHP